jgi:hypothetical protein
MVYKRVCITCNTEFETNHPKYLNCSKECNNIYRVNQRYERENNDWERYFKHLLSTKKDHSLTVAQLIGKVAEQDYKCALSGQELTCYHVRGKVIPTNASLDRINPGKEYNYDNVQIVCRATNNFRADTSVDEYIDWCIKVAFYALQKQKKTL